MQLHFRPSMAALMADDRSVVDSDLAFVRMHYAVGDWQPGCRDDRIVVERLADASAGAELLADGKAADGFGSEILVYREESGEEGMDEPAENRISVMHSLRQLYTKLKLNDNILEKPSLLQTTIFKVGYEGDHDLLESLVGTSNLFQDSYPYYFIKTGPKMKPQVDFQFILTTQEGKSTGIIKGLVERGIIDIRAVSESFLNIEVQGQPKLEVRWPQPFKVEEISEGQNLEEGFVRLVVNKNHREPLNWIRYQEVSQGKLEPELKFKFESLMIDIPENTPYFHDVFFFLGKSHLLLRKTDFTNKEQKGWQKMDGQYMHKLTQKKALDSKPITAEALNMISQELCKITGSQMFFYSYSKIANDPVVRMVSFESLPLYPRIPKLNMGLEDYLSKKLTKK